MPLKKMKKLVLSRICPAFVPIPKVLGFDDSVVKASASIVFMWGQCTIFKRFIFGCLRGGLNTRKMVPACWMCRRKA